jgi:hypothetical protein
MVYGINKRSKVESKGVSKAQSDGKFEMYFNNLVAAGCENGLLQPAALCLGPLHCNPH